MRRRSDDVSAGLSVNQRLHRIAELLSKAVLLAEAERLVPPPMAIADARKRNDMTGLETDRRIMDYLIVSGEATPLAIRSALGISRTTAYRSLLRLESARKICGSGRARALVYRLFRQEPAPDRIGLN